MKPRYNLTLLLAIASFCCAAQHKTIKVQSGTWQFTQYAANIIKVSFKPTAYSTSENVSDAVLLKPQMQITIPYTVQDTVAFIGTGKKISITAPEKNNEFNSFKILLNDGEKIFGGGERALPLNRRGYKFNLYNNPWYGYAEGADNLNYSVPFFTSSNGYGLFFDNVSRGYADIGKTTPNIFEAGFTSGELNVYVILGNDYKEILSAYHKLTGTQPLPPRWAMGNLMSRFGYTSQQQVTDIVAKMKAQHIPVDAVIFDLFWFGDSIKGTMGNLAWTNKTKWPNPPQMIAGFKKQNINTILITEPFVLQSSTNYNNSKPFHAVDSTGKPYLLTDFYFGKGGLIDIFRKDAQQWFWNKHQAQMKTGVEAWWGDLGEPEKHPADLFHNLKDKGFTRLFKAA
jgi:oligosaccharide 4-alpha-D-glucosyltransferase